VNEKYAFFIWTSYGITLAVLLWNWLAPRAARARLHRVLIQARSEEIGE
jgi:heme exporter protein CcmD